MRLRFRPVKKIFPDAELIEAIQRGQDEVDVYLEYLYDLNRAAVRSFILKNRGSGEEAEEILHAGVIRVYEQIVDGKFRGESKISSYLIRICRNLWIDQQKRAGNRLKEDVKEAMTLANEDDDPLRFMERKDLAIQVRELLTALDERCRKLLMWSDGEGRPMKWIAQQLDYSLQAAMNKKSKCRKNMREKVRTTTKYQSLIEEIMAFD